MSAEAGALARAIAAFLPRWVAEHDAEMDRTRIMHPSGPSLVVHLDRWKHKGRVEFIGETPMHKNGARPNLYGDPSPRMTRNASQSPEEIARAVSRFLPTYLGWYEARKAKLAELDAEEDEAVLVAHRLALISGGTVHRRHTYTRDDIHVGCGALTDLGRVQVSTGRGDGPTVSFEVSGLDPDSAARVFSILREAQERAGAGSAPPVRVESSAEEEDDGDDMDETVGASGRLFAP